jgi:hypothetical protein
MTPSASTSSPASRPPGPSDVALEDAFSRRLEGGDLTLFEAIESQTSSLDRTSLLACQGALRRLVPRYVYLEIGSHLGGTIQPHLLDPRCRAIYSIDKRVAWQPDARGPRFAYDNNSTQRMLHELGKVSAGGVSKVSCLDGDSRTIDGTAVAETPHLFFLDGEHTDEAVLSDFRFCRRILARADEPGAIVVFHDSYVIYNALAEIVDELVREGAAFHAYNLPESVFVLELNGHPLHHDPAIAALLVQNHLGYLSALRTNDHYRRFALRPLFRWLREMRNWLSTASGVRKA